VSKVSEVVAEVCRPGYGQAANEEAVSKEAVSKEAYAAMMHTMMAISSIIVKRSGLVRGSSLAPSGRRGASGPTPRTTTIRSR